MADEPTPDVDVTVTADVDMEGATAVAGDETVLAEKEAEIEEATDNAPEPAATFMSYLMSPIITLLVGNSENPTVLTAHQALLVKNPFFKEACAQFVDDGSPRQIELVGDDLHATGCFLEYLYTGDYFPRKIPGQRTLEKDPAFPDVDDTGDQLLRHARVYTIAEKFGSDELKSLASSKIHCIDSTAKGEIAFARYVYQYTRPDDKKVRAPIASFWAARSHSLRSEAEEEFKSLCLEFPQFGYDVLTRVLDEKLKREKNEKMAPSSSGGPGSGRKRARHSGVS